MPFFDSPSLAILRHAQQARDATLPASHDYDSNMPDPHTLTKVLVLVTVFGWLVFGIICILCINGRGRAGRWVPEWYLDSEGRPADKAAVVTWWVAVVMLWPAILPVLMVRKIGWRVLNLLAKTTGKGSNGKGRRQESSRQSEDHLVEGDVEK
ncbi:hypothetical protein G7046_g5019 [Stylonectria norvegica]|nr:hypothetical protein G7046_g5019 [Stylonectria norvegica]